MTEAHKPETAGGEPRAAAPAERPIAEGAKAAAEPFFEFFDGFKALTRRDFAFSAPGTSRRIVKFLLGSMLVASVIELLLPSPGAVRVSSIGVVNDAVLLSLWLAVGLLVAAFVHRGVRRAGGTGTFSATLVPYLYIVGVFYPPLVLMEGLIHLASDGEYVYSGPLLVMMSLIQLSLYGSILARTHGIEPKRAAKAAFRGAALAAVPIFALYSAAFWMEWTAANKAREYVSAMEAVSSDEAWVAGRTETVWNAVLKGAIAPADAAREFRDQLLPRWSSVEAGVSAAAPPSALREHKEDVLRYYAVRREALEAAVAVLEQMAARGRRAPGVEESAVRVSRMWAGANETMAQLLAKYPAP